MNRFVLDGVLVEEVPCDQLPKTNMCNYCVLKGTACYSRRDVDCHGDSRPDGQDVVFRRVQDKHSRFQLSTPAGNSAMIQGDPQMPASTKAALAQMVDAVYAAHQRGELNLEGSKP